MAPPKTDEYSEGDYTSYEKYIPNINYEYYKPEVNWYSFDNLFTLKYLFSFWAIIIIIIFVLVWKNAIQNKNELLFNSAISGIIVMVLISLYIFINARVNIKYNIVVIKTKLKDDNTERILFKTVKKNDGTNQLNLITIDGNEEFDRNSAKKFFNSEFDISFDDIDDEKKNIGGPYLYNKETHVYFISIKLKTSLLTGKQRNDNNYRFISIDKLKDYNKNKNDYNMKKKYNENVLPILFNLDDHFMEQYL